MKRPRRLPRMLVRVLCRLGIHVRARLYMGPGDWEYRCLDCSQRYSIFDRRVFHWWYRQ